MLTALTRLRDAARRRLGLPAILLLLALAVRLLVPAGFMVAPVAGGFAVVPCSGLAMPPAHHGHHPAAPDDAPSPEMPCAFAGATQAPLPLPALVPPPPLPVPVGTPGLAVLRELTADPPRHLRPPLRGPPPVA